MRALYPGPPLLQRYHHLRGILRESVPLFVLRQNVEGCYAKRSVKKSLELADVVVPCPDCGTFTIATDVKKGKETSTVKEIGVAYDRFSRVKAAEDEVLATLKEKDADDMVRTADACTRFAEELLIIDPDATALPMAFAMAVKFNAGAVEKGRIDRVNELARVSPSRTCSSPPPSTEWIGTRIRRGA